MLTVFLILLTIPSANLYRFYVLEDAKQSPRVAESDVCHLHAAYHLPKSGSTDDAKLRDPASIV
jgi:hypothetical protein